MEIINRHSCITVANKILRITYTAGKGWDLCISYSQQPVLVFKMRR